MLERLEAAPGALLASRDRLGDRPVRLWNEMEAATARDLPLLIDEIETAGRDVWADGTPDRRRLADAAVATKAALAEHGRWLEGRLANGVDRIALGPDAFDTLVGLRAFDGLDTRRSWSRIGERAPAWRHRATGGARTVPTSTRPPRSTA